MSVCNYSDTAMNRFIIVVILFTLWSVARAEVFLCLLPNGETVAQDTPCPQDAKTKFSDTGPPETDEIQAWRENERRVETERFLEEIEKGKKLRAEQEKAAAIEKQRVEEEEAAALEKQQAEEKKELEWQRNYERRKRRQRERDARNLSP